MILVDYMSVAMSVLFTQMSNQDIEPRLLKHMILNTLRTYNVKFREEYGEFVLATDNRSWRKDVYAEYKAGRSTSREESGVDWKTFFEILNSLKEDINEHFPWRVVSVVGAEADDVIASLVIHESQKFGKPEPIMIVSSDKDFIQLQVHKNVKQFSPMLKKMIQDKNPRAYLREHILTGDGGDGVPNVLSPDNTFVAGLRQRPLLKKRKEPWMAADESELERLMDEETYRNYQRNKRLIDLNEIPRELYDRILATYDAAPVKSALLSYFVSSRLSRLIECCSDFQTRQI